MNSITQSYTLDMSENNKYLIIQVPRWDISRVIEIELTNHGLPFELNATNLDTVTIRGVKPDGKTINNIIYDSSHTNSIQKKDGVTILSFSITEQMSLLSGKGCYDIEFKEKSSSSSSTTNIIRTFPFYIYVAEASIDDKVVHNITSTDAYSDLMKRIADNDTATVNANTASTNANNAATNANNAADYAKNVSVIKSGTTDPSDTSYVDKTLYINTNTMHLWRYEDSTWTDIGTIKCISKIENKGVKNSSATGDDRITTKYQITFNDNTIMDYFVKDGRGIDSIETPIINPESSTSGVGVLTKRYTINYNDNTTSNYDVIDGRGIDSIIQTQKSNYRTTTKAEDNIEECKNTFEISYNDNSTPTNIDIYDGLSSYLHIRYSKKSDGTDFVENPNRDCIYIGIVSTTSSIAPTDKTKYKWVRYLGIDGTGAGDLIKEDVGFTYDESTETITIPYGMWKHDGE